jgi:hypothetical protein
MSKNRLISFRSQILNRNRPEGLIRIHYNFNTITHNMAMFLTYDHSLPVLSHATYYTTSSWNITSAITLQKYCGGTKPVTMSWHLGGVEKLYTVLYLSFWETAIFLEVIKYFTLWAHDTQNCKLCLKRDIGDLIYSQVEIFRNLLLTFL